MSDNLPVPSGGYLPARYERKLTRATARELAVIRAREDITTEKIRAIGTAGHVGMATVAGLALDEANYAQQAPQAAFYVNHIARTATFAVGREVENLERALR